VQAKTTRAPFAGHRRAKRPPSFAQRLDNLALQRDQRLAEIAALRQRAPSKFLDDAGRLLAGRFWARARAPSREQLLQTVDWLIALARRAEMPPAAASRSTTATVSSLRETV